MTYEAITIDIPAARRLRAHGIDLVSCVAKPALVGPLWSQFSDQRWLKRVARIVTGRRPKRGAALAVLHALARWFPKAKAHGGPAPPETVAGSGAAIYHGQLKLTDAWQWLDRLLGTLGTDGAGMTLATLVTAYEGRTYHDLMVESSGIAGGWNAKRTKSTAKWWTYTDFHPAHQSDHDPRNVPVKQRHDNLRAFFHAHFRGTSA